jgi:hypothetical protein
MATASVSAPRGRRERAPAATAVARVRWDRVGRVALLGVLVALLYLYLSAGVHLFTTWRAAHRDRSVVAALEREHLALARQHDALGRRGTLETEARGLGMVRPDERGYVITGLPNN